MIISVSLSVQRMINYTNPDSLQWCLDALITFFAISPPKKKGHKALTCFNKSNKSIAFLPAERHTGMRRHLCLVLGRKELIS